MSEYFDLLFFLVAHTDVVNFFFYLLVLIFFKQISN